ncbi:MAG: hypothetical protein GXP14_11165 [Gammaproteobacteria bacterium]|nr:hypothetical protein [Gammaproteobacteria bacterium]
MSTKINGSNELKIKKDFILFLVLVPILLYPVSPVFHIITINAYGFGLYCMIFIFISLQIRKTRKINKHDFFFVWVLVFFLMIHIVLGYTHKTDFRLLLICFMGYILLRLNYNAIRNIVWYFSILMVVVFVISIITKLIVEVGWVNLLSWRVDKLNFISSANPSLTRYDGGRGDFTYYMPFYLTNWQIWHEEIVTLFGSIKFYRFPFIFSEPFYFSMYAVPLVFCQLLLSERSKQLRVFIALVIIIMIVWSFSYSGLILLFIVIPTLMLFQYYLAMFFFGGKNNKSMISVFIACGIIFIFILVINWELLFPLLGESKLAQLEFFTSKFDVQSISSLFGVPTNGDIRVYGSTDILVSNGILGMLVFIWFLTFNMFRLLIISRSFLVITPLVALSLLLFKAPLIIYLYYFLIYAFVLGSVRSHITVARYFYFSGFWFNYKSRNN